MSVWNAFDAREYLVEASGGKLRSRPKASIALYRGLGDTPCENVAWGREMLKQNAGFDFHRYHKLLTEAVDEPKRLALIDILVEEQARDRLAAHRAADRKAATAATVARALAAARFGASSSPK